MNIIQILQLLLSRPWSVGHRGQVVDQAVRQVMARATGAGRARVLLFVDLIRHHSVYLVGLQEGELG